MALDTSILELADDIAYGTHDFEDGVALELITRDHWEQVLDRLDASWAADFEIDPAEIADSLFAPRRGRRSGRRKRAIGALVNAMVSSVTIRPRAEFESPIVDYVAELSEPARLFLHALSELNHVNVIALQSVQTLEYRGRYIVMSVFEALKSDWKALLGLAFRRQAEETGDVRRAVCDYVAGMTDSFVTRMYERLFVPRHGSVFERI